MKLSSTFYCPSDLHENITGFQFEFIFIMAACRMVLEEVNPDIDNSVNLFETTIRIIGGLLSAYRLTNTTRPEEARHLLDLAIEVGSRLHPGFNSPSGKY